MEIKDREVKIIDFDDKKAGKLVKKVLNWMLALLGVVFLAVGIAMTPFAIWGYLTNEKLVLKTSNNSEAKITTQLMDSGKVMVHLEINVDQEALVRFFKGEGEFPFPKLIPPDYTKLAEKEALKNAGFR